MALWKGLSVFSVHSGEPVHENIFCLSFSARLSGFQERLMLRDQSYAERLGKDRKARWELMDADSQLSGGLVAGWKKDSV